jgi:tetratricopeptide (TPR) repeat protein
MKNTISTLASRTLSLLSCLALLTAITSLIPQVNAQISPTGSRINGSGGGTARQTLYFAQSSEIAKIKRLLNKGLVEDARVLALEYVNFMDDDYINVDQRYQAYNMLCAVYIKSDELEEALDTCSIAIDMKPGDWSAYNNRATTYMLLQEYDLARADYAEAIDAAASVNRSVRELLSHNLDLLERRQGN